MTSESTAPTAHPLAPDDRAVGPFAALLVLVALAVLYVGMIVLNVAINRLLGESGTDDSQTFVIAAWASGPDIVLSILAIAVTWLACRWAGGASWRRQCGLYMPMAKPAALALIPQWGEIFHHWPYLIWFVVLRVYLAVCRRYVNSLWLCYFLRVVAEVVFWGLTVKYLFWDGGDALWLQIRPSD